ncbi:hypothetical protein ElyMa_006946200 [Elysia marginata]|uniref:C-type lectin domain-containing protein n=1 Tax=Elysia marginata TaxID=1093978 RepID=A0AAV4JMQ8_9GAST|nr:hypothetical protein ElyMa_006946200 [Elysia marginata]
MNQKFYNCADKAFFVCEYSAFGIAPRPASSSLCPDGWERLDQHSCVIIREYETTWAQATGECRKTGGRLLDQTSESNWQYLNARMPSTGEYWVGDLTVPDESTTDLGCTAVRVTADHRLVVISEPMNECDGFYRHGYVCVKYDADLSGERSPSRSNKCPIVLQKHCSIWRIDASLEPALWPSGKDTRSEIVRFGFDPRPSQTKDFKIGISS